MVTKTLRRQIDAALQRMQVLGGRVGSCQGSRSNPAGAHERRGDFPVLPSNIIMFDWAKISTNTAENEAIRWLIDFDDLSLDEQVRFIAWLSESPENGYAFQKMEREWRRLDVLRVLAVDPDNNDE